MAERNGRRFVAQMSGAVRDQLRDAVELARSAGEHAAAVRAAEVIARRLVFDAHYAGEPLRYLSQMRQTIRKLAVAPLYVEYMVHDAAPLVVVRRVALMTG